MWKQSHNMSSHIPVGNKELSSAKYGHISWLAEMFTVTAWHKLFTKNQIWFRRPDTKPHNLNNNNTTCLTAF